MSNEASTRIRKGRLGRPAAVVAGIAVVGSVFVASAAIASAVWSQATPLSFAAGVHGATADDQMVSVSCASVGACTATGLFKNAAGGASGLTVSSTGGVWGQATPIVFAPGVEDSSSFQFTNPVSVSCASVGNCTVVGQFHDANSRFDAFTVSSVNGVWAQAVPVTFAAGVRDTIPDLGLVSVKCASAGNCSAVGSFRNPTGDREAFTVSSVNGVWGQGVPVTFAAGVQHASPRTGLYSVSCASAGNCTGAGTFKNATGGFDAFTVSSVGGTWAQAVPVTFVAGVQNASPDATLYSVSCGSAGNCTAVGRFKNAAGGYEAFTVTSVNGVWGQGTPVAFAAGAQTVTADDLLWSVSCASAGNCTAGGMFREAAGSSLAFTVSSVNGVWGQGTPVTFASGAQSSVHGDAVASVSCVTSGNCSIVGQFKNPSGGLVPFVASSSSGVWGQASQVGFASGVQSSTTNDAALSVSCASAGNCGAVGRFTNAAGNFEGFTLTQTDDSTVNNPASAGPTTVAPALPATGRDSAEMLMVAVFAMVAGLMMMARRNRDDLRC